MWWTVEEEKRSAYLEQPVAPAVEGGDDGGVYVAAIQTLEGKKTGEEREERTLQYKFLYRQKGDLFTEQDSWNIWVPGLFPSKGDSHTDLHADGCTIVLTKSKGEGGY